MYMAVVHVLPVLCGFALASYPWLLAPVFVACSTNVKAWKPEMKYCYVTPLCYIHWWSTMQ